MKTLSFGTPLPGPGGGFQAWATSALKEIEGASAEDIEAVLSAFTITGTLTERRTIDAGTGTLAELRDVVCTFINDVKKRGSKKSYAT